jgi:transposase InsO family protein
MVGRILTQLKRHGRLVEPPRTGVPGSRRALRPRPYAVRKPKQYAVLEPGDLVEVDTLDVRPVPGVVFKQFTARDVVSRWDVLQAHTRATAFTATQFLDTLQHRMPFPIRAVQVDGGSEFAAEFEQACQQRELHLFVLPPRSPKLNGAVERANRTHSEEFYPVTPCSLEMKKLNRELRRWEKIYNPVRPHQALGYLTPQ